MTEELDVPQKLIWTCRISHVFIHDMLNPPILKTKLVKRTKKKKRKRLEVLKSKTLL